MENNKNGVAISDEMLEKIAGGGTGAAEEYLLKLQQKYHCERYDLCMHMTREEYAHYVYLYNN